MRLGCSSMGPLTFGLRALKVFGLIGIGMP